MNILFKKQKGVAAIELTLIIPFLLFIIFATVEFSRMLYQYNALNKVVRDSARYLIVHAVNGSTQTIDITGTDIAIATKLLSHGDTNNATNILPNLSSATVTYSVSSPFITVSVVYYWQPIFFSLLPNFINGNASNLGFPLRVNYTMRALIS